MTHILLVEDDETLRTGLCDYFSAQNYRVTQAADGNTAEALLHKHDFDLLILDLMLPGPGGLELLREFRTFDTETPVLILTARGDETDKVLGLELGADDYITKPFGLRELAARVRAHLRRSTQSCGTGVSRFLVGDADINLRAYRLSRGENVHKLSPKEVGILELLHRERGKAVSRTTILNEVWGGEMGASDRTIDTHVLHLRQKIEDDPKQPRFVQTVHGVGYRLCLDGER